MSGGTTTNTTKPLKPVWSRSQDILGEAQGLYDSGRSTVAPLSDLTRGAIDAYSAGSPGIQAANTMLADTLGGRYLSPDSNPYLRQTFDAAARGVTDNTNAIFSKAGRYGSGAHQDVTQRGLGELAASIYAPAYQQERGLQFSAANLAPALGYAEADRRLMGGQLLDTQAQREVDDPYTRLQRYLSAVQGVPQGQVATQKSTPGVLDWINTAGNLISSFSGGQGLGGMSGGGAGADPGGTAFGGMQLPQGMAMVGGVPVPI